MKKLILPLLISIVAAGCKTSSTSTIGPALLQIGVTAAVGAEVASHPETRTELTVASGIVCAVSANPNSTPTVLVDALNNRGGWNPQTASIINAVVSLLSLSFNGLTTTNAVNQYMQAACAGMNAGLGQVPSMPPPPPPTQTPLSMRAIKSLKPGATFQNPNWPHVR